MKKEVILSGFGGQGVMSIGKNLVEAAVAGGSSLYWHRPAEALQEP